MLLTPLTPGCLITDPIEPQENVNFPPSIVSDLAAPEPRYPIEQIVILDRDVEDSLTFNVIVRDPNFDDELEYAVLEASELGDRVLLGPDPVMNTGELERPLSFTLNDLTRFDRGECHKIELRVSRALGVGGGPIEPGDIDIAVWWINSLSDDGTPTDLATCPD